MELLVFTVVDTIIGSLDELATLLLRELNPFKFPASKEVGMERRESGRSLSAEKSTSKMVNIGCRETTDRM